MYDKLLFKPARLSSRRGLPANSVLNEIPVRKSTQYYTEKIHYLQTDGDVRNVVDFLDQRSIAFMGIGVKYSFGGEDNESHQADAINDPKSINPLLLSIVAVEPAENPDGYQFYQFAVDLRKVDTLEPLKQILKMKVPFIGYDFNPILFSLWRLGLNEPETIWDIRVCERLMQLGLYRVHSKGGDSDNNARHIREKEEARERQRESLVLVNICLKYEIIYGMDSIDGMLRKSFHNQDPDKPFSGKQINYAIGEAAVAAKLYAPQHNRAFASGELNYAIQVEMPWVISNARIEWNGMRIDVAKRDDILQILEEAQLRVEQNLKQQGLENVNSDQQLEAFFTELGLIHHFHNGNVVSFDKKILKQFQRLHPAIKTIRDLKRIKRMQADQIMFPGLIGSGGRIYPQHRQLGADTGRQTTKNPSIHSLDGILRPLVIPAEGCGIGEADWSQMEIGIAAAEYDDKNLIDMFNSGDVYSMMAQQYFGNALSDADRKLPGPEFKQKHSALRKKMKTCILGILYQMTPGSLAEKLGCSKQEAERLQLGFMGMFPQLRAGMRRAVVQCVYRGYATAVGGVRRYRNLWAVPWQREQRWFVNHPIQASAAVIMKIAGNRLDRLYRAYDSRLLVPLHDSFVFEVSLDRLPEVAKLTESVMIQSMQEVYPELRPKVDVNIAHPECWNKDGNVEALEDWVSKLKQDVKELGADNG